MGSVKYIVLDEVFVDLVVPEYSQLIFFGRTQNSDAKGFYLEHVIFSMRILHEFFYGKRSFIFSPKSIRGRRLLKDVERHSYLLYGEDNPFD
jgi:hypothetical protein